MTMIFQDMQRFLVTLHLHFTSVFSDLLGHDCIDSLRDKIKSNNET